MNKIRYFEKLLLLSLATVGLSHCTPKPQLRQPHENARQWVPNKIDEEIKAAHAADFAKLDLRAIEALENRPEAERVQGMVIPLSKYILNQSFISLPQNRNRNTEFAMEILFRQIYGFLKSGNTWSDEEKVQWATRFENILFAGCNVDFSRGCINASYLGRNAWTSKILLWIATSHDKELEAEIKKAGTAALCIQLSENCRFLTQIRYRQLAMVYSLKMGEGRDNEAAFAYVKFIRPLNELIQRGGDIGYLTQTYLNIFEMLIAKFETKGIPPEELKVFIESFNPWTYSAKRASSFRHGAKSIFQLAASCCLYADDSKTKMSDSIREAIRESQEDVETDGMSFKKIVSMLRSRKLKGNYDVATSMGIEKELAPLESDNSDFYNEYFYLVDRIYHGHIDSTEATRILERLNPDRTNKYLLNTLQIYLKVHLLEMTLETIDFMNNKIYNAKIPSDLMFSEALNVSRDVSMKWMRMQGRLDILQSFAGGYYNRMANPPKEFELTTKLFKSAKRNVHYISVYPNMIGLSYFLAKNQGKIIARSWWGEDFEIDPTTVVSLLIEGSIEKPWFKFASDPELLSREKMFYAFYYALKTQALDIFSVEEKKGGETDRAKFFELTLGKYLENDKSKLIDLNQALDSRVLKPFSSSTEPVCNYETGKSNSMYPIQINLDELTTTTYTSFGPSGVAAESRALFTGDMSQAIEDFYKNLEPKLIFANAIISMVEQHMIDSGEIKDLREAHAELKSVRAIVNDIKDRQRQVMTKFFKYRKLMFECSKKLYLVELARYYRIYIEEKNYLGRAYDAMAEAQKAGWSKAAVESINKKYFSSEKFRFDGVEESQNFRLSKIDYLMRVKKYIETDIFSKPTQEEQKRLGPIFKDLYKPRKVVVSLPPNVEVNDLISNANQTFRYINFVEGDKNAFVREGLKLLDGTPGSYAEYGKQANQLQYFKGYLMTLINLYLLGDIDTNGNEMGVCSSEECKKIKESISAEEILATYKQIIELVDLTEFDVEINDVLGETGRMAIGEISEFLVEKGSLSAQPLLRHIMEKIYRSAGFTNDTGGILKSGQNLTDMLSSEGVIIFDPGSTFKESLLGQFAGPINRILKRAKEFYSSASALESRSDWQALLDTKIRVEGGKVITVRASSGRDSVSVVDRRMESNLNYWLSEYVRRTENRFKTQEALK